MDHIPPVIGILLAHDNSILRAGLRNLLQKEPDLRVVAEAADSRELIGQAAKAKPNLFIVGLKTPGSSTLESLRCIASSGNDFPILVLATANDREQLAEAVLLGVRGVVFEDADTKVLIRGIHSVMKGEQWFGCHAVEDIRRELPASVGAAGIGPPAKTFGLTRREMQIVSAIVSGFSNREVAGKMSISEDTVKHHVTNIFDKLGVYNRLELTLFAIHHGLVRRPPNRVSKP